MIKHLGQLALLYKDIEDLSSRSISRDVVKSSVRNAKSYERGSWQTIEENGTPHVLYDTIPAASRAKLPPKEELLELYEQKQAQRMAQTALSATAPALGEQIDRSYPEFMALYVADFGQTEARELAKAHAAFDALRKQAFECLSHGKKLEFWQTQALAVQQLQLRYLKVSHWQVLKRKVEEFATAQRVVPRNKGNHNALKHGELIKALIERLWATPNKMTVPIIHRMLQQYADTHPDVLPAEQVPPMSYVRSYCANRQMQQRLYMYRYGAAAGHAKLLPPLGRVLAMTSCEVWQMDGTRLQLASLDASGKPEFLWIYLVQDVFSRAIVGYHVSKTEDWISVKSALHMAVNRIGFVPAQIIHDNSSAHQRDEIKALKEQLGMLGAQFVAAPVGRPTYKAEGERVIGVLQERFFRTQPNYIGEGIRTKRKDGRTAPEYFDELLRTRQLPDEMGLRHQVASMITAYNQLGTGANRTPNELLSGEKPYASAVEHWQLAMAFYAERKVTINRSRVKLTVRHQVYEYDILGRTSPAFAEASDAKFRNRLALNGEEVLVRYDETDLDRIVLFALDGRYLCDARLHIAPNIGPSGTEADKKRLIIQAAERQRYQEYIQQENERRAEVLANVPLEALNPATAYKDVLTTAESQADLRTAFDGLPISHEEAAKRVPVPVGLEKHNPYSGNYERKQRPGQARDPFDEEGSLRVL